MSLLKMLFLHFDCCRALDTTLKVLAHTESEGFLFDNNSTQSCRVVCIIRVVFSRVHCFAWDDFVLQT